MFNIAIYHHIITELFYVDSFQPHCFNHLIHPFTSYGRFRFRPTDNNWSDKGNHFID